MSMAMTVFVGALILLNIVGCLWLISWTTKPQPGEEAEGAEKSHVWDGDLRELNNPLPRWWLNLFYITIVFTFGYLLLYPGFGSFAGTLGWSQEDQHDQRLALVNAKREAHYAQFEQMGIEQLSATPAASQAGGRLFADNCAGCHGPSAQGAIGFPNLTDQDWLYGSSSQQIVHSIAHGRTGVMPAFGAMLQDAELDALVGLLANWQQPALSEADLTVARAKFGMFCAACHGAQGKGNPMLGAPNLTDAVWLYGNAPEQLRQTISAGRSGVMPAHRDKLSEAEIKLLAAYVYRFVGQ